MPREDVIEMLQNEGDFLVRKSEENAGDKRSYVLSVRSGKKHRHYIFREQKGRVAVDFQKDPNGFKTIRDFINYYTQSAGKKESICTVCCILHNCILINTFRLLKGQNVHLVTPIKRKRWELGHDSIQPGKKLGSGAFGIVRQGEFRATQVAIKVIFCSLPRRLMILLFSGSESFEMHKGPDQGVHE